TKRSRDSGAARAERGRYPSEGLPEQPHWYDPAVMCGIVGYVGSDQALPIILEGLRRLEYRGYDSAGVAVVDGALTVRKREGKLSELERALEDTPVPPGTVGMGHTRWATHGVPSD